MNVVVWQNSFCDVIMMYQFVASCQADLEKPSMIADWEVGFQRIFILHTQTVMCVFVSVILYLSANLSISWIGLGKSETPRLDENRHFCFLLPSALTCRRSEPLLNPTSNWCPLLLFAVAGGEGGDKEGASTSFLGQYSFAQVQAMSAIIGLAMLLYVMGRPEETQEVGESHYRMFSRRPCCY